MNYIKHLNNVLWAMCKDERLLPTHVSLYMALFQLWNDNRFQNPLHIDRKPLMKSAKMGSLSTYTKCIRELQDWGYLGFSSSNNPSIGTRVQMYEFRTGNCTTSGTENVQESVQLPVQQPYINIYKDYKESKQEIAPTLEAVFFFFQEKKFTSEEAKKFYNHYQANGWLMGGKTPIKDWQASAEKWMSNVDRFNNTGTSSKPKPSHLHATNDKDYSEPL